MGLLDLFSFFRRKNDKRPRRIVVLGLDNAGKTTMLKAIAGEDALKVSPTKGFNVKSIETHGLTLTVWDIGGQRSIRSHWRNYLDSLDGLVFVIDSSDRGRREEEKSELYELLNEPKISKVPLLVLANKQDLIDSVPASEVAKQLDLQSIKSRPWSIQPCSATSSEGLSDGLAWLSKLLKKSS